jgi:hypothetical protein
VAAALHQANALARQPLRAARQSLLTVLVRFAFLVFGMTMPREEGTRPLADPRASS